ncbi:unnamed protein product [Scytosiphon promiscuus]
MALAINSQRQQQQQDDEPPVMTLPAVITAAQAAGLAAEKRMRDNRHRQPSPPPSTLAIAEEEEEEEEEEVKAPAAGAGAGSAVAVGMGAKRVGRVRGRGALPAQREETFVGPRSAAGSSDVGNGSSVYGTGKSQIQPTETPPPLRHEASASATPPTDSNENGPFFNGYEYDDDDDESVGPGFRRGPTSYNSPNAPRTPSRSGSPTPPSPPLTPPAGPPPSSPCGTPAGSVCWCVVASSGPQQTKRSTPLSGRRRSAVLVHLTPSTRLTPRGLPRCLRVASAAAISPNGGEGIPTYSSPSPVKPPAPLPPSHQSKSPSTMSSSAFSFSEEAAQPSARPAPPARGFHNHGEVGEEEEGERAPPLTSSSLAPGVGGGAAAGAASASASAREAGTPTKGNTNGVASTSGGAGSPPSAAGRGNSVKGKAGAGGFASTGVNEDAMESDLDFIRELTRYRGGAARASAKNDE